MRNAIRVAAVLGVIWFGQIPASAKIPLRWSCSPSGIYVQPGAGKWVTKAVEDWRQAFRPDWTYTTTRDGASVTVSVRGYDFAGAPMAKGSGVTGWSGKDGRFTHADVLVSKRNGDTVQAYNVTSSELQHVAGFGYEDDLPWGDHDGSDRLLASEVSSLRDAGRDCV